MALSKSSPVAYFSPSNINIHYNPNKINILRINLTFYLLTYLMLLTFDKAFYVRYMFI
jgi:hypothetical protein